MLSLPNTKLQSLDVSINNLQIYDDYFGLDCSHLNEKGQGLAALYLWNNMASLLEAGVGIWHPKFCLNNLHDVVGATWGQVRLG